MSNSQRRTFLKGSIAVSAVGIAAAAGLLSPIRVLAAWPADAFALRNHEASLKAITGTSDLPAGDIEISAPEIAENGAMVSVTIESGMPDVTEIALFVVKNGQPLAATFLLGAGAQPMISIRVKMAETSDVVAAVKSGGVWYGASREVKVTLGGCGG
jgi:sulfur-oxidizing protein SoxY